MSHYYLDSSALLKRYKTEVGSDRVQHLFELAPGEATLSTSQFTLLEVTASAARLRKAGVLGNEAGDRLVNQLLLDSSRRLDIVLTSSELVADALQYVERYALKAPDAIQLASAVAARIAYGDRDLAFVGADLQRIDAASQEGSTIINPDLPS